MNRFTRYKFLQALWHRARALLTWHQVPRHQEQRARAHRWQQINVAERQMLDGVIRGGSDPDSAMRPQGQAERHEEAHARQAQREAQRQWLEQQQRQEEGQRQQRQHLGKWGR